MLGAIVEMLQVVFTAQYLMWLLIGVAAGLCLGAIPVMSGTVGMTLLLPFIFGMDPYAGMALLIGMTGITNTSDTFPAVLLGVPGSSGSQATIMDGYPMARQGRAAEALGAAFFVSMVGGIIGASMLFGSIYVVRPLVLTLQTPEYFMLSLLGVSMVGVLSRGAPIAGLLAGLSGLLVGMIGIAPATAVYRFTFGAVHLIDGLSIVVVALSLFALPEMIDLLVENKQIAKVKRDLAGSRMEGVRQAFNNKWLITRSAIVGNLVGVVPGLGGNVVDWFTYGMAKQTCKNTENFGNGDIRGVIAPESANNAKESGTLVPTLFFGIPGSPGTAVLLGGLVMLGIFAGPDMLTTRLPLTLSIIWTLVIANVLAAAACFALSKHIAKIAYVPSKKLVPFIVVLLTIAAYQNVAHFGDILLFMGFGLVAWVMKRMSWPRAPLLVGFVLSEGTERYMFRSIARFGYGWLLRPTVIVLAIAIIGLVWLGIRRQARQELSPQTVEAEGKET